MVVAIFLRPFIFIRFLLIIESSIPSRRERRCGSHLFDKSCTLPPVEPDDADGAEVPGD